MTGMKNRIILIDYNEKNCLEIVESKIGRKNSANGNFRIVKQKIHRIGIAESVGLTERPLTALKD
jgi:hypothetical protein